MARSGSCWWAWSGWSGSRSAARRRSSPRSPLARFEPGAGNWSVTLPSCAGTLVSWRLTVTAKPAPRSVRDRGRAQIADHVRHRDLLHSLGDDDADSVADGDARAGVGRLREHLAGRLLALLEGDRVVEAPSADRLLGGVGAAPDHGRHGDQARAAGDGHGDQRAAPDAWCRRTDRSRSPHRLGTELGGGRREGRPGIRDSPASASPPSATVREGRERSPARARR